MLWLILAVLLATIVAIYLLRPPVQILEVASTLLWSKLQRERHRRPWRWWLSVALCFAFAGTLLYAASDLAFFQRALWGGTRETQTRLALVLDDAPSHEAAGPSGRQRLDWIVEDALDVVDATAAHGRYWLIGAARSGGWVGPRDARRLIQEASTTRARSHLTFVPEGASELHVFSDGTSIDLDAIRSLAARREVELTVHSAFEPAGNWSIRAVEIAREAGASRAAKGFVEVARAGGGPDDSPHAQLELVDNEGQKIARPVELAPGGSFSAAVDLEGLDVSRLEARIVPEGQDAFAGDDSRSVALGAAAVPVTFATRAADSRIRALVGSLPGLTLAGRTQDAQASLLVANVDGWPDRFIDRSALLLFEGRPAPPELVVESRSSTTLSAHPITDGLDPTLWASELEGWSVETTSEPRDPALPRCEELWKSAGGTLAIACSASDQRHVLVHRDVFSSRLSKEPQLAIFLQRTFAWLAAGNSHPVDGSPSGRPATDGTFVLLDSLNESVIEPRTATRASATSLGADLWTLVLIGALVLACVEFASYMRGVTD